MAQSLRCTTTKTLIANMRGATRFVCPSCLKTEIVRSPQCRKLATRYRCAQCGFEGPN